MALTLGNITGGSQTLSRVMERARQQPPQGQTPNLGVLAEMNAVNALLNQIAQSQAAQARADNLPPGVDVPELLIPEAEQILGPFKPPELPESLNLTPEARDAMLQDAFNAYSGRLSTVADQLLAERKDKQQRDRTAEALGLARGQAETGILDFIAQQTGGSVAPETFQPTVSRLLDDIARGVSPTAENPGQFFGNTADIGRAAIGEQRELRINDLEKQFNQLFPQYFASSNTYLPDTADDATITRILEQQFADASRPIENATLRGNLNPTGSQRALEGLRDQRSAALSRLQQIGGDVLESRRGGIRSVADDAYNALANFDFGQSFSFDPYTQEAQRRRQSALGTLEGDILSQLGETQLFRPDAAIQAGGVRQGVVNSPYPSGPSLLAAIARSQSRRSQPRGLGTTGAF